jgi:hypothetical protein
MRGSSSSGTAGNVVTVRKRPVSSATSRDGPRDQLASLSASTAQAGRARLVAFLRGLRHPDECTTAALRSFCDPADPLGRGRIEDDLAYSQL